MDYAAIARNDGLQRHPRRRSREAVGRAARGAGEHLDPTVIDVIVTRDPAKMLPGVDNRTLTVKKGDRPV